MLAVADNPFGHDCKLIPYCIKSPLFFTAHSTSEMTAKRVVNLRGGITSIPHL